MYESMGNRCVEIVGSTSDQAGLEGDIGTGNDGGKTKKAGIRISDDEELIKTNMVGQGADMITRESISFEAKEVDDEEGAKSYGEYRG